MKPIVAITNFSAALNAYGTTPGNRGSSVQKADLVLARAALVNGLVSLAAYCENTTPYNRDAFLSGGWDVKEAATPVGIIGPVRDLIAVKNKNLNYGEVLLDWKRPLDVSTSNVKSYNVYRGATSNFATAVIVATVTRSRFEESGLTSSFYYYWVVPIGTAGPGITSDVCVATVAQIPA